MSQVTQPGGSVCERTHHVRGLWRRPSQMVGERTHDWTRRARGEKKKMVTQFFMAMRPPTCTAQEKQVRVLHGKPQFYEPQALAAARAKLCAHLGQHRPEQPYTGGVRLVVKWLFPRGKHPNGSYRTTKPDTDNLQKLLRDCMTAEHFWTDDALVCSEITEKFWADTPGIWIHIEPVEG